MRKVDSNLIFSPTDLSTFFLSPYVSWLNHFNLVANKEDRIARELNPTMDILAARGTEFEEAELERFKSNDQLKVVEIQRESGFQAAHLKTIEAMKSGADVIYQAALEYESFSGYADFLIKVPGRPSNLGNYSYEVSDTKLSHTPKPEYALQICCYNEMLVPHLGHWPETWHLRFGDGSTASYPVSDYQFYYLHLKSVFLKFHQNFSVDMRPFPEAWETVMGYEDHVNNLFTQADHLSLVAGVGASQLSRLKEIGIESGAALAKAKEGDRPRRMQRHVFNKIREQASLQIQTEQQGIVAYRILTPEAEERLGLACLPQRDDADVIFDMEGYPFQEGGLEYLFGVLIFEQGQWLFKEWTARDISEEKATFEKFMDWLIARFQAHPGLHVYHYAHYEPGALARLSNKYGTRVAEVDLLLASEAFVDLYRVVREGVRVGTRSYSIKHVEALYNFKRTSDVSTAGDSVIQFHNFLELREVDPSAAQTILNEITQYNKEDVESTLGLLDWLHAEKAKHKISYVPSASKIVELKPPPDWEMAARQLESNLPIWIKNAADDLRVNKLVADLIGYFKREERPVWWAYFSRINASHEELVDDAECIGMATVKAKLNNRFQIQFDPNQLLKLKDGQGMFVKGCNPPKRVTISSIDLNAGTASINGGGDLQEGEVVSLIPSGPLPTTPQQEAILRMAERWVKGPAKTALGSAGADLLYRRPPRVINHNPGSELYPESEAPLEAAYRLTRALNESCLSIQGPPGTGKTYTAGFIIAQLLKDGKRVAVVSQGRKTIEHLIQQTVEWWRKLFPDQDLPEILMADNDDGGETPSTDYVYKSNTDARKVHGNFRLVGATHFVFSRTELHSPPFDYLFIDEAGQFSLAAALVCSFAAKNLILLGDQMQLEQVNVGQHPGDSGHSVLNYYMNGQNTIPRTHGVFLDQTWRLNPAIAQMISYLIYDGRLRSHERTDAHVLKLNEAELDIPASGIFFLPVEHAHNSIRSEEEVEAIVKIFRKLLDAQVPHTTGKYRKFKGDAEDLIVITPYNAQVELIRSRLKGAKVGTVDLFQGQEAWVSILSMCASGEEGLHRGLEFLLSKNRMNVGLSRAKALSIVVGSPRLLEIRPRSIKMIPLLNLYAALFSNHPS